MEAKSMIPPATTKHAAHTEAVPRIPTAKLQIQDSGSGVDLEKIQHSAGEHLFNEALLR